MTTLALVAAPERTAGRVAYRLVLVVAGSLLVAAAAQFTIHLWFTPIPITGQTLGVLLVGASLGAELGAASLLLYLAEGGIGLPFFAAGSHGWSLLALTSVFGGYFWGFVVAAGVVGFLAKRGWDRSFRSAIGGMLIGEIVLYSVAIPWFAHAGHLSAQRALVEGLYPFIVGDTLKLVAAAALLPAAWRLLGRDRA